MATRNQPGASFGSGDIARKYGNQSAAAGAFGERQFAELLNQYGITRNFDVWYSLSLPSDPRNPGGTKYNSDVDVAIASGDRLLLVDVKRWASGFHYWTLFGLPFKGLTPMMKNGQWKLGANMAGALSRYRANLPGMRVDAIVVFVTTNSRGASPSSVAFFKWPGGIKSYLHGAALSKIKSFMGRSESVNPKIEALLSRMSR